MSATAVRAMAAADTDTDAEESGFAVSLRRPNGSEKIEKDIDGYNTRPLLSGRVFCACGNEGWHESACKASGFVPAEMGDDVKAQVRP